MLLSILLPVVPLSFLHSVLASSPTSNPPISSYLSSYDIPSWQSQNFTCAGPPDIYTIESSPGKGLGVFAAHALEPGDVVMREAPMMKIIPPQFVDGAAYPLRDIESLIREAFAVLSLEEKDEVLSLHSHELSEAEKGRNDKLIPIFRNNAYTTGKAIGLFPKIARINHSCRPNLSYIWNERLGKRVVYATRRVEEGEEIFVTYIPLLHSHEDRQKRLDQYGFKCTCEACAQEQKAMRASDKRRIDIRKAFNDFEPQLTLSVPQSKSAKTKARKNANASVQLVHLVEEEGLADYYARAYRTAAISHARIQDWPPAAKWAHKSYQFRSMADAQSSETIEMHALTSSFIASWNDDLRNKSMKKG